MDRWELGEEDDEEEENESQEKILIGLPFICLFLLPFFPIMDPH